VEVHNKNILQSRSNTILSILILRVHPVPVVPRAAHQRHLGETRWRTAPRWWHAQSWWHRSWWRRRRGRKPWRRRPWRRRRWWWRRRSSAHAEHVFDSVHCRTGYAHHCGASIGHHAWRCCKNGIKYQLKNFGQYYSYFLIIYFCLKNIIYLASECQGMLLG
jgi:hypothetical protein